MVNKIIVFKEKHADRYFDASTPELLGLACVRVLRDRAAEGYWYHREYENEPALSSADQEIFDMTDEALAALPAGLRADFTTKRTRLVKNFAVNERRQAQENEWFDGLEKLLALSNKEAATVLVTVGRGQWERTIPLAYSLLQDRADGEYEGFEIERLESVED